MSERLTEQQVLDSIKKLKEERKLHMDRRCECTKEGQHLLYIENCNDKIHYLFNRYLK